MSTTNILDLNNRVTSVEDALDAVMPRTASGTTLAQLVSAIGQLSKEQKYKCIIKVNNNYRLVFAMHNTPTMDWYNMTFVDNSYVNEFRLEVAGENSAFKRVISNNTSTSISVSSWVLYYRGTPIS